MVGRGEARPGLDDRRRDAEPGVDLGQLAAGRPAAQDQQAAWQLAGERRLLVRPDVDPVDARDRVGRFETDPTATMTLRAGQLVACAVVA